MGRLLHCRRGATSIEYGLFAALAALLITSGVSTLGENVGGTFAKAGAAMAAPAGPQPAKDRTHVTTELVAVAGDARLIRVEDDESFLENHQ